MPELPEVEIIRRYLADNIVGKTVAFVESLLPRMWRNTSAAVASDILTHETVESVDRRGKYLVFTWSPSGAVLLVHLKLTGRLIYRNEPTIERFDRVLFHFTDGTMLAYGDIRTLGALYCFPDKTAIDVKAYLAMGVEPLSRSFTAKKFGELVKRSSQPIKPFLLAQTFVAGLGNIYVDEALFMAHVLPIRPADSLTEAEVVSLHRAIRKVLRDGLANGGTSFRDYRNGEGKRGHHQEHLQVYGRAGKPCRYCGRPLADMTLRGRHTVFCETCQK